MTTQLSLQELRRLGKIHGYDPELLPGQLPDRCIDLLPRAVAQYETRIVNGVSSWKREISPEEQLDALFRGFCLGDELIYDWQFKDLRPLEDDVWELKTPDVRAFGWFHAKDFFIISSLDIAGNVKERELYYSYIKETVFSRIQLYDGWNGWVTGQNINDHISNWCEASS